MQRQVSPLFATIVVAFAIIVGGLYFAWRYRADEAARAAEAAMLQQQAERERRSGDGMRMMRRGGQGGTRRAGRGPAGAAPGGASAGRAASPSAGGRR